MGGKKKKSKKKKGAAVIEDPDDQYKQMDGETLEKTRIDLKDKLADAGIKRNML